MSEPAANPGSDADIRYGMDRAQALEETGLDSAFPLPGRTAERYGERSGIYLSVYEYPSSGRDSTFTSKHYVMVVQRGAKLTVRSVPASGSQLSMDVNLTNWEDLAIASNIARDLDRITDAIDRLNR